MLNKEASAAYKSLSKKHKTCYIRAECPPQQMTKKTLVFREDIQQSQNLAM